MQGGARFVAVLLALTGLVGAAACGGTSTVPITANPDGGALGHADGGGSVNDARGDTTTGADGGCGAGKLECGHVCVDGQTDNANCGVCNNICGVGLICQQGACGCPPGLIFCNGACVDTNSNESNCGSCDNACAAGVPCGGGACGCGAPTTLCGTVCANESTSPAHCGSCDNACSAGDACTDGKCGCAPGETDCGGSAGCVNLTTDSSHCGTTCPGSICEAPLTCQNASCGCPSGSDTYCVGTSTCTDVETDPENCGTCGTSCNGQTCVNGGCTVPPPCAAPPAGNCSPPYVCLSSTTCACPTATPDFCAATNTCVNVATDPENCSTCGTSCNGGTCSGGVCSGAACTLANNDACVPGSTAPDSCCAMPTPGITCASVEETFGNSTTNSTYANLCCLQAGAACDDLENGTCCGFMACDGTMCACQEAGHHCVNAADCCTGDCTSAHICDQTCVLSGVSCQINDMCCGAGGAANTACPAPATGSTDSVCP